MSIDLCGSAVRIPPHKHRVACSSRRIFNNVRISHGRVVKCTYSPHNWEPQEELHNQNWQPQQDHNWQQQQQHYNQQQQQHYNQQQQQHYNQQQQRPYNQQQQQDHNWQQQQQHYNQQQQQQPYNQQQQPRFYNQQQQQFSNQQQQQPFYNQQPDSIQSQQQPEPNFNDISGLSDLSDLSSDTDSTRFVPSFSRVARRGFAKRYELFPGGPVDTSPQEGQQDGITPPVPDESMDLPKGPTHKEMIAARRHYLKRQARRGLLPPSRPIRKRFPLDDSF